MQLIEFRACLAKFIIGLLVMTIAACSEGRPTQGDPKTEPASDRSAVSKRPPNFLVVLADDLGYSDLGFMGGEIATPHLDDLARKGVTFTNFHASPTCSPSRAMLLTGTDAHTAGLGNMAMTMAPNQVGQAGYEGHLSQSVVTIASLLRVNGYDTHMAGKWHLGIAPGQKPSDRGFDKSFAIALGGGHFTNLGLIGPSNAESIYLEDGERVTLPEDFYSSRSYVNKLIKDIGERDSERPFFAYLSFTAPHWPLQAPAETIEKYRGKYDDGFAALQIARLGRMKALGLVAQDLEMDPTDLDSAWTSLSVESRRRAARTMEVYAAMIDELDSNLGRLLRYLEDTGESDNTVVVFLSDNGAAGQNVSDFWGDMLQDYLAECCDNSYENMGAADSYLWTGPFWARASSTPFRLFKGFPTEGGLRVPALIYDPRATGAPRRSDDLASIMDIAPTLMEMAGIDEMPATFDGRDVAPMEGTSLQPYLTAATDSIRDGEEGIGWELFGRRAFIQGQWKVLSLAGTDGLEAWGLYDLQADPGELNDLATQDPERAEALVSGWEAYSESHNVILPNTSVMPGL